MTVKTAGKETCGYEGREPQVRKPAATRAGNHPTRRCRFLYLHYAVRMTVGTAGKETCGYEDYAVRMTVETAGKETCGYEHYAVRMTAN